MPSNIEDWVHRVGRTGRAGTFGTAYTFFTQANSKLAGELINILQEAKQLIPPSLLEMRSYRGGGASRSRYGNRGGSRGNPYSRPTGSNATGSSRYGPSSGGGSRYGGSSYGSSKW